MKSPFIHITDTHIYGVTHSYRKDDYLTAVLTKLQEVVAFAEQHSIKLIVHTGDFFNEKTCVDSIKKRIIQIVKSTSARWLITPGQHDLSGKDQQTYSNFGLGILEELDNVTLLFDGCYLWEDIEFFGFAHRMGIEDELRNGLLMKCMSTLNAVVLIHALIGDGGWGCIHPKEIPVDPMLPPLAVLSGDYHKSFFYQRQDGVIFSNPGPLARK